MNNFFIFLLFKSFILLFSLINAFYIITDNFSSLLFKFFSIILIFLIIYISTFKHTFLPFLAESLYPFSLIPNSLYPPNTNFSTEIDISAPNGTKIIYWASNSDSNKFKIFNNPSLAYTNFHNSGVAIVNNNKAILHLFCPNKYIPPSGLISNQHIHYRIAFPNNPILSDVKTIFINC